MEPIKWSDLSKGPLNVLPYGEPGCGKTYFGLSVGEVCETLYVDVDNGLKTALGVPRSWLKKITPVRMTSFKDIDMIYRVLERNDPDYSTQILGRTVTKPFEAVVYDTWSEVNWEIKEQKRMLLGKDGKGVLDFRPNIEIQDWGNIADLNQMCIVAYRDLPIHFICCMHEMFYEDKKGGRTSGTPSINGKFAGEIGKFFDILGHMSVDIAGNRVMDTVMKARYQAKSRIPVNVKLIGATFKTLQEAIPKIVIDGD
jgi:hypothetical protein